MFSKIKKYKWIVIILMIVVIISIVMKIRQDNHDAVSFVANITNELHLTGEDGRPMLTGAECIAITKDLQQYAATSSYDFDDIKDVMQILNDGNGMSSVSTSLEYEQALMSALSDLEELSDIFNTKDYRYLTNEMLSYSRIGIPLSNAKNSMIKLNNSAKHAGISYQEAKVNIIKN